MRLTDEQIELYSRQIILREVGGIGQQKLRAARVLIMGSGAARDACASYLVGAGIGELTLVASADAGAEPGLRTLPAPETRVPDARVRVAGDDSDDGFDDYDVALWLSLPGCGEAITSTRPGRPRAGSVVLARDGDGALVLHLLRRDHGCVSCLARTPASDSSGASRPADDAGSLVIAMASAGTLAALACCRWLLGIGDDAGGRTLRLAADGIAWEEGPPPRRMTCARGCPPPDEAV